MKKHVSELTPEEFQKVFPITLKAYDPRYQKMYQQQEMMIRNTIDGQWIARINHIGSSAIPRLISKPVVDILMEVDGTCRISELLEKLKTIDFGTEICNRSENPFRMLLSKGMTCEGFAGEVFLLHIRYAGDWDELYFRDYLLEHPDVAKEYGELKERILKEINEGKIERMPNGRPNGYSNAKLAFVKNISAEAKKAYRGRYAPCPSAACET